MKRIKLESLIKKELKKKLQESMIRTNGGKIGAVETMKDKPPFAVTDSYGNPINEVEEPENMPAHFGSGENIEVFGYQTKHFDICKSAVMLFNKITPLAKHEYTKKYARLSAKYLDEVFGIEKDVVEEGSASPEQIETALDKSNLFSYELGCVGARMKKDYTRDMAFVKMHLMEIVNRFTPVS